MTTDDLIPSLRAELRNESSLEYPRPTLSGEEEQKYARVAVRFNSIRDQRMRLTYIAAVIMENARLLKEVNEHRATLGLAPLPVYDPEAK